MSIKKIFICIFLFIISLTLTDCSIIKSTESIKPVKEILIPKHTLDKIIKENVEPICIPMSFGGKPFCTYKVIDLEKKDNTIKIYVWLLCEEFYVKNNKLIMGTGAEFPSVIVITKENNNYKFINCNISRIPSEEESLKIFPKSIRKKAIQESKLDDTLLNEPTQNAKIYFKSVKKLN